MLDFFRRYQRFFFLIVTVIIIISFSFFGTYNTISGSNYHEQTAFTAVDGSDISRLELEQMAQFIGTDAEDKLLFGGQWGPNFLNDGVITQDFLQNGLGKELALAMRESLKDELQIQLEKEKRFAPYQHPQANFISAESAWNYVTPDLKTQFDNLRRSSSALSPTALDARVGLYLAQKKLPPPALRQLLLYQQKQFSWVQADPTLEQADLSLFGYHTATDWFGAKWLRLMSAFVINSAKIAEKQGYYVSKAEALADLQRNAELSYRQNVNSPYLGVTNSGEYFNQQLNRLGIDQSRAVAIWQQVLLFRRLFNDAGNTALVDPFTFEKINAFAQETATGEMYRLPPEFNFNQLKDLQKFELYLKAISKESSAENLKFPTQFYTVEEVLKTNPELVQKRYLLDIVSVDKDTLQAKVPLKEMWNWEVEHWDLLKSQFPELSSKPAATREERFATLDGLDPKSRNKIDIFARKQIVDAHTDWLKQALEEATARRMTIALTYKKGATPFVGLTNQEELMTLLDKAKLNTVESFLSPFTADHQHYYKITVLDRSPKPEIVTFAEAQKGGLLDYQVEKNPIESEFLNRIKDAYAKGIAPQKAPSQMLDEITASLRFYVPMQEAQTKIKKDNKAEKNLVKGEAPANSNDKLATRAPIEEQWKLVKASYSTARSNRNTDLDIAKLFAIPQGQWSSIETPANGNLYFFFAKKRSIPSETTELTQEVNQARQLLADEAERSLMFHLLKKMQESKALALKDHSHAEIGPDEE